MRKAILWTSMVLLLALALPLATLAADHDLVSVDKAGIPSFVRGDLGFVDTATGRDLSAKSADGQLYQLSVKNFLVDFAAESLGAIGTEDFEVRRVREDRIGKVHTRFDQELHGLRVVGAQMIVHADAETGAVYAVNGNFARDADVPTPFAANKVGFNAELHRALRGDVVGSPKLAYFHDAESGKTHLTWEVRTQGVAEGQFFDNLNYVDFRSGEIVAVDAQVHTAKSRQTYDATGSVVTSTSITGLPGVLKCNESTTNCNDASAQRAHDGAGDVYDYYQAKFGRDSLNNAGMVMSSSVHVGSNWANAAWYNNQMIYGDGDGSTFDDLTKSFDVIAHELTHGVTDFESDLIYQNESGALNEAFSDIFAAAAEAWKDGVINASTWQIGEDIFIPGGALRYMDNPTQDGSSYDYYPERYTGSQDNGGVHWNSGIANLAFYLLVEGGTHPRNKTTVNVPAIGMAKAEQVFYRAQTTCLTSSSNFEAARNCTAQAATDLYGATENGAVHDAWDAVGVPGGGGSGGGVLQNGVAETGLSGSTGSSTFFTMTVPSGATNLSFTMSGGSGDPDLYVRFGSQPSTSTYDCRSWNSGPSETCSFASPSAGTYHVLVYGYSTYSGLSLTGSYTASSPNQDPTAGFTHTTNDLIASFTDTSSDPDGTIASRSWNFGDGGTSSATNPSHTYSSGGTYTVTLTVTDDDGATGSTSASVTVTDPPAGGGLSNGVPVTGLAGGAGSETFYTVTVPAGATNLSIAMSGGSGDADLYVRFGSQPTTGTWDCRPYVGGNNENCDFASPSAGTYHVMIRGYSAYSGASLVATWTEPGGGGSCGSTGSATNLSASTGNELDYTFDVDACATSLTITISGGSGDADLHVNFGSQATTSNWDCRPYQNGNNETCTFNPPQAGTYHIMIRAYSTFSGVNLSADFE